MAHGGVFHIDLDDDDHHGGSPPMDEEDRSDDDFGDDRDGDEEFVDASDQAINVVCLKCICLSIYL